eukprot:TRINITY_DN26795_c0_g1_i1.p1 TRINITY_DN26795_c0_g1~~TRINITY_DN26795_c0_g1_i1.p1  ORF type:complete len:406 (-),score=19.21 TRINITY_DN26795_c0_g1_i1:46-1086(-)
MKTDICFSESLMRAEHHQLHLLRDQVAYRLEQSASTRMVADRIVPSRSVAASLLAGAVDPLAVVVGAGMNARNVHKQSLLGHGPDIGLTLIDAGFAGILFEGDASRSSELQTMYEDRSDVLVMSAHVHPFQVPSLVGDVALFFRKRQILTRTPTLFPHFLQIGIGSGDCDFLEEILHRFTPRVFRTKLDTLSMLVPPSVHYRSHSHHSDSLSSQYPGDEYTHAQGCSLGAIIDLLGPDYGLVQLGSGSDFVYAAGYVEFAHVNAVVSDGISVAVTYDQIKSAWRSAVEASPLLWVDRGVYHGAYFDHHLLLDESCPVEEKVRLLREQAERVRATGFPLNVSVFSRV